MNRWLRMRWELNVHHWSSAFLYLVTDNKAYKDHRKMIFFSKVRYIETLFNPLRMLWIELTEVQILIVKKLE